MCFIPLTDSKDSSNALESFSTKYFDSSILSSFNLFKAKSVDSALPEYIKILFAILLFSDLFNISWLVE